MSELRPPDPGGLLLQRGLDAERVDCVIENVNINNIEVSNPNDGNFKYQNQCNKRVRTNSPFFQDLPQPKETINFLVVKRKDGDSMSNVSPFLIEKILSQVTQGIKNAKKLKDGSLLVETFTHLQAEKLLSQLPHNINLPVTVEPHRTLNQVKGVITCSDLQSVPLEDIKAHLTHQGVADIRRINRKLNNILEPTNSYIVTMNLTSLPAKLKVGYLLVPIRPYIPLPMRCFQCHRYNHLKVHCKTQALCAECGEVAHENQVCTNNKFCINCKGQHSATDKQCPRWQVERKLKLEISDVTAMYKRSYKS